MVIVSLTTTVSSMHGTGMVSNVEFCTPGRVLPRAVSNHFGSVRLLSGSIRLYTPFLAGCGPSRSQALFRTRSLCRRSKRTLNISTTTSGRQSNDHLCLLRICTPTGSLHFRLRRSKMEYEIYTPDGIAPPIVGMASHKIS